MQRGIGHISGSSLPVGGDSTHAVLSGHRGFPSSKLFTDLVRIELGDVFTMTVLNETYTYTVDQILIVLPDDMTNLTIIPGEDYLTLVTCTPYAVNSHRLLVRGNRIENLPDTVAVTLDAVQIDPVIVAPILAVPVLLLFILPVIFIKPTKR